MVVCVLPKHKTGVRFPSLAQARRGGREAADTKDNLVYTKGDSYLDMQRARYITFIFFLCVLVAFPDLVQAAEQMNYKKLFEQSTSSVAVFFLPHQDDEMFMAGAIVAAQAAGKQVYVLLVTDGAFSSARSVINGSDDAGKPHYSPLDGYTHNPQKEGYAPLTHLTFSQARNREYFASMQGLGLTTSSIWFANPDALNGCAIPRYSDGLLNSAESYQLIGTLYKKFGDGLYATVAGEKAPNGYNHSDHRALRNALVRFPGISQKYFFLERAPAGTRVALSNSEWNAKYKALSVYYRWDPRNGFYGIGNHSVGPMLTKWRRSWYEYFYTVDHFTSSTRPK